LSDVVSGKIKTWEETAGSFLNGSIKTGISKLAKALNDTATPQGNAATEAFINAG
jgi:hypothetical protein